MKKKAYALPNSITSDIGNTMELVKNNIGTLNYKIVPISAIEFDPQNPRELNINQEDILSGIQLNDPLFDKKNAELESLKQMAETIKKYGVRNAVEIYKFGTGYRLIHGERRCLSSILAGKKDIPAKVLDEKPNDFDVRLLQFIENIQREDLTLNETLNNIKMIIAEYKNHIDSDIQIDASFLEGIINKSKSHCYNYLSVLSSSKEIQLAIKNGQIRNLERAALIANVQDLDKQKELISLSMEGANIKELRQKAKSLKNQSRNRLTQKQVTSSTAGKKAKKINMGATVNTAVIKKLIYLVSKDSFYLEHSNFLCSLKLDNYNECASSFKSLIQLMEKIEIS